MDASIKDLSDKDKQQILVQKDILLRKLGLSIFDISEMIASLEDDKTKLIFMNYYKDEMNVLAVRDILKSLKEENRENVLRQKELLMEQFGLSIMEIMEIAKTLKKEETKLKLLEYYEKEIDDILDFVWILSDEGKIKILLKYQERMYQEDKIDLLTTLSPASLIDFINQQKAFWQKHHIKVYEITSLYPEEKQLKIALNLENIDLSRSEKVLIAANFSEEVKEKISSPEYPKEYLQNRSIESKEEGYRLDFILVDLNLELEWYRGLDDIILVKPPMNMTEQEKERFLVLCEICPQMKIKDLVFLGDSTVEEYKYAENWIKELIQNIGKDWTDLQKIAYVDHAIGQKVVYDPTYETEVANPEAGRALWKVIASGCGICEGIAQVEKYILDKIGMETEMVYSQNHAFLKLKNIEWKTAENKYQKGNTTLDPTWNLSAHRYGYVPNCFCRSYEEIRKMDLDDKGKDTEAHKNIHLSDASLDLDNKTLGQVFASIGLANAQGEFPIYALFQTAQKIDNLALPEARKIEEQLRALENYYPDFASAIQETTAVLRGVSFQQKNQNYQRCVVKRVYEKKDPKKRPVLYVYMELPIDGKKFYYADARQKKFVELPQKEFEERFSCYQKDLEKENGTPWKQEKREKIDEYRRI